MHKLLMAAVAVISLSATAGSALADDWSGLYGGVIVGAQVDPERKVQTIITENMLVNGDAILLKLALENMLNNAWKYTSKIAEAKIEFSYINDGKNTIFYIYPIFNFYIKYNFINKKSQPILSRLAFWI